MESFWLAAVFFTIGFLVAKILYPLTHSPASKKTVDEMEIKVSVDSSAAQKQLTHILSLLEEIKAKSQGTELANAIKSGIESVEIKVAVDDIKRPIRPRVNTARPSFG